MRLLERIGIIGFYLAWPALYIYLRRSERTRIVVLYEGRVLVLKNWLSDNRWSLPGGGLHEGEDPREGAARELLEETGIRAMAADLEVIGAGQYRLHGLGYPFHSYVLRLSVEPTIRRQRIEVSRIGWLHPNEFRPEETSPDVLMSLELLKRRHPDFLIQ
jgi:8-oxo-dGTP pyrophosphatase MutT (NUDIX family)